MSERKTISINPDLFSFSSKTGTRKKRSTTDENGIKIKPPSQRKREDSLKKRSVLKMIRQRQEELYKDMFNDKHKRIEKTDESNNDFNKEFNEAQNFLENLTKKKEEEKKHKNMTLKQYPNNNTQSLLYHPSINPINNIVTDENISLDLPAEFNNMSSQIRVKNPLILPPPQYGCLKRGTLPTYRSYLNQTRKQPNMNIPMNMVNNQAYANQPNITNDIDNSNKLVGGEPTSHQHIMDNNINEGLKRISEMKQTETKLRQLKHYGKPMIKKQKKIRRRTHKIGKSKVFPRVSVLVSNKTLRNNISTRSQLLKQIPIQDVKKYLMKHGLIKIGSTAPNDVLRKMYESAIMICGEVQNHNPENLLHNFIHGE